MVANLARAAFLLFLAVMVVSWAVQASQSEPAESIPVEQLSGTIYC